MQEVPGKISMTFDVWKSHARDAYLLFTIHYVTVPQNHPTEWCLVNEVLGLPHLEGGHSGSNQADVLVRVINHYGIGSKVSSRLRFVNQEKLKVVTAYGMLGSSVCA